MTDDRHYCFGRYGLELYQQEKRTRKVERNKRRKKEKEKDKK